ncbi:MAG: DsrE family protein [Thermodesulfovibrionales bacterium]|jgi:intracellular sulfur oxidation DsrE/DsrF family protein
MKFKVLLHVNEPERWAVAISNIINFLNDVSEESAEVVVVANGSAVKGYVREGETPGEVQGTVCAVGVSAGSADMEELSKRGVLFLACRNALHTQRIAAESLPDFVTVVPAGITEIVRRQADGFAYIKP